MTGGSALLLLLGIGLLYMQLQGLDKSDMDDPEPLTVSSTIEEQVAEAQRIRQEQHTSEEMINTLELMDPSEASLAVQAAAENRWPDNQNMQDSYTEKQMTALSELSALEIDASHKEALLNNAIQEHKSDFRKIQSEYLEQLKAHEEMNAPVLSPLEKRFIENARAKYGDDYKLIRHEYSRQLEAYEWVESQTLDTEAKRQIMAEAKAKRGEDYAMIRFVYEEQFPETKE